MPQFKNLNSLFNYLGKELKFALQQMAYEVEKIIKDYIMDNWYNRPDFNPERTQYTRTYDYINSLTVSKVKEISKGKFVVEIYFDTDKIRPLPSDDIGRWSRHESIIDGEDVSFNIPYYIEYGNNSPIYSYDGVRPIGNTIEFLERTSFHVKEIMEILKKKGYNVKIN